MAESASESTDINESNLFPLPGKLLFIYTKIRQKSTDCSIRLLKVLLHLFVYWYLTKKCVSCLITGISFALTFAWGSVTFDISLRTNTTPEVGQLFWRNQYTHSIPESCNTERMKLLLALGYIGSASAASSCQVCTASKNYKDEFIGATDEGSVIQMILPFISGLFIRFSVYLKLTVRQAVSLK